jgi:predicted DNA-binding ribbon-helix-helix protein
MLQKRSLSLASHRTSLALEPEFWSALEEISRRRGTSLAALIAEIDQSRDETGGLAQAVRVYALGWYRANRGNE